MNKKRVVKAEVMRYSEEFKNRTVELRRVANETEFVDSLAYLEWKYEANPYVRDTIMYIAVRADQVVAMRGMYGTRWHVGRSGKVADILCADDFAVAKEVRSSGVAARLMHEALVDLAKRGESWLLNASGGYVTVLSSLAAGWKSIGAMAPLMRRNRRSALHEPLSKSVEGRAFVWRFGEYLTRSQSTDVRPYARLDSMGTRDFPRQARILVGSAPRAEEMSSLAERFRAADTMHHVRDPAFYKWRYANPERSYRFVFHETAGELTGFLVFSAQPSFRAPNTPFRLVEWEGASPEIKEKMLTTALRRARFPGIECWSASFGERENHILRSAGFVASAPDLRARGLPAILLRTLREDGNIEIGGLRLDEDSSWNVQLIDSMHG